MAAAIRVIDKVKDLADWDQASFLDGQVATWNAGTGKFEGGNVTGPPSLTGPQIDYVTSIGIAAGGSSILQSQPISAGKTASLLKVCVTSSVPFKATLQTVTDTIVGPVVGIDVAWLGSWTWVTPTTNFVTVTEDGSSGFDGFQVTIKSLDPGLTADFYCVFYYNAS